MKTFEQHTNIKTYYSIRWNGQLTNQYGNIVGEQFQELDGEYDNFDDVMKYVITCFNDEQKIVDSVDDFKIVKVEETTIDKKDLEIWQETNKYNL